MSNEQLNEKTKKMAEFSAFIVGESCAAARQQNFFQPDDMPNVFLSCCIEMMMVLKKNCKPSIENKKNLDLMAQALVTGLVKSLQLNDFVVEATVPEPDKDRMGVFVAEGMGRA